MSAFRMQTRMSQTKQGIFIDDVNGGSTLDKELAIEARLTGMEYSRQRQEYKKVPRSDVKNMKGKVITIRWMGTEKEHRELPNYR